EFVRNEKNVLLLRRVDGPRVDPAPQGNHADQKAEQKDAGGDQRRDIDRTALPQFTAYGPIPAPNRRDDRVLACLRFKERPKYGVGGGSARAALCGGPV